ncbi:S1 RNA-binding domain-containing protein [Thermodesulfobacterium sp. TA1]|uniref:S1 RNA-binding domain-containing protein n=1 Tax=Thermodesulfobacterium sp. TA1 TaxID=2234087 RepID=UPI001232DF4F|nr:S1 RNA-binding domain-containing protein [Thermodesulfobacterium sp. TA1]QER41199.1 S1 RNA-binding domain-containing protein [Thermodesulfobacterium sp. TA1]
MSDWGKEFEEYLNRSFQGVSLGEIVKGTVVKIGKDYAFIDVGLKGEALLPLEEIKDDTGKFWFKEGDEGEFLVVGRAPSGGYLLSYLKIREKRLKEKIKESFEKGVPVKVRVVSLVKGGYSVKVEGLLPGFLPFSQAHFRERLGEPEALLGAEFEALVTKLSKDDLVVSKRALLEREYELKKKEVLEKVKQEGILEGEVFKRVEGGFLVDFQGVFKGFLPDKELSWFRISDPDGFLKKGDKIKVKVLSFEPKKEQIKVSIKALEPDPWEGIEKRYQEGQRVKGKVVGVFDFGAFLELEPGVEGLIPRSEIGWNKNLKPKEILGLGDLVEAVILEMKPSERKMVLSLRRLEPSPWERLVEEVRVGDVLKGKVKQVINHGILVEVREGVEGFVHVSNLSWGRVENLKEKFVPGQELTVKVLEINPEKKRLVLSIKHLTPDPWESFAATYKIGYILEGVVRRIVSNGVIVEVSPEIEGFIPFKELSEEFKEKKFLKPEKVAEQYKPGDKLKGKIVLLDPVNKKLHLSCVKYIEELENQELENYKGNLQVGAGLKLGDLLAQKLSKP